jgi:hypothetical protein
MNTQTQQRPINEIAREIDNKWKNIYFGARPYLNAMYSLKSVDDNYGHDSAESIIRYFLGNASTWRGEDAKRIKNELKSMIN